MIQPSESDDSTTKEQTKESELFESIPPLPVVPSQFRVAANSNNNNKEEPIQLPPHDPNHHDEHEDPLLTAELSEWDHSIQFPSIVMFEDELINTLHDRNDHYDHSFASSSASNQASNTYFEDTGKDDQDLQNSSAISLLEDGERPTKEWSPSSSTPQLFFPTKQNDESLSFVVTVDETNKESVQENSNEEKDIEEKIQLSSTKPSLQITIQTSYATKNGVKAIKPCAFSNKRTIMSDKDKSPSNMTKPFSIDSFDLFIVVKESCHGENIMVELDGQLDQYKKLELDPVGNHLLQVVKETAIDDHTIELYCKITTSNNYGWKTKHALYNLVALSKIPNVCSALSEGFKVTQNVS
ncbi:hypothetical protein FDP41_000992 [Naegleria fowleri]|uniref:Uncharacterized protein n=1 Tax=Naegleria fowleri TaxID=5763 RepID=A0A6A5C3H2_NAEFO|nr:uncharacterized protein FDP41_000992 [Naegleria fowleri]KAF0979839.1 hypothetical protein FDP41_000992 [Naegleria fowleri]